MIPLDVGCCHVFVERTRSDVVSKDPWFNVPKLASVLCSHERRFIRKSLCHTDEFQTFNQYVRRLLVFNSTLTLAPTLVVSQAAYPHHEKRIALTLQPMLIFGNKIVSSICWSRGDLRRPEQNIFDVFSRTSGSTELAGPNWTGNGVNPILLLQKMNIGVAFIVWPWSLWPWRISCCQPLWPSWPYCVSRMTGR